MRVRVRVSTYVCNAHARTHTGDKTKFREVRQRLVVEEEERNRRMEEEQLRLEEEVRVTREEAELMERMAEEAARMKAEGDAARKKAAQERAAREREDERMRRGEEANQERDSLREEDELRKRVEAARQRLEEEQRERHRPILEIDRIIKMADSKQKRAESEAQTKGPKRYQGCFGKCNNRECRKLKEEHFESDKYCHEPRVLAAAVAKSREELTEAKAKATGARNNASFLAAEAKAKEQEEKFREEEAAFDNKKTARKEASAAAAKQMAEVRAKVAQEAAEADKEETEEKATADRYAATAVAKQVEVKRKADAHAQAADMHLNGETQAREAFFKRIPFAVARGHEAQEEARKALVLETRRQEEQSRAEEAERKCQEAEAQEKAAAAAAEEEEEARAKATAKARVKGEHEASVEAREEAEKQENSEVDAAAAVKKHAEAVKKHAEAKGKTAACAEAASKDPLREAFFKRTAALGLVRGQVTYDSATESLIAGVPLRLEPNLSFSSFSAAVPGFAKAHFRADKLPHGLTLDAETGVIEGTPSVCQDLSHFTVTAHNSKGETSVTIPFKIVAERAPSSLSYDAQVASTLIVGVEMNLAPKPGFVVGVPRAKFKTSNNATLVARALEYLILKANGEPLVQAIQQVYDVYDEIIISVTTLKVHTDRVVQLKSAMLQEPPLAFALPGEIEEVWVALSSDLGSQSLEDLEEELADLNTAVKSAVGLEQYGEAQALKEKHDIKRQDIKDYIDFKSAYLDPLRACCNEMLQEFGRLDKLARKAETLLLNETVQTRTKELADSWDAVARELQKVIALQDQLLWLDLSSLQSAAASAHGGILQKVSEYTSTFALAIQRTGDFWTQATQDRQVALEQFTVMQRLLDDTVSKPSVIQQNIGTLAPQDLADKLQQVLSHVPKHQTMELKGQASVSVESFTTMVGKSLDLLKKTPVMPQGFKLNETTGEITVIPEFPLTNCVFTVHTSNTSGECAAVLTLCAQGQIAPAGLTYASVVPAASEFANPPHSTGLLLLGDASSMEPSSHHRGLPAGNFNVTPPLPAGLTLNAQTGEILGTPSSATARRDYTVTLQNPSGMIDVMLSLEVQKHTPPSLSSMGYDTAWRTDNTVYTIIVVGCQIDIRPTQFEIHNHFIVTVLPPLPAGLTLDSKSGVITGTPTLVTGKTEFTITAHNARGQQSAKIAFAVADDWQGALVRPDLWTVDMCLTWFKSEIELPDDKLIPFMTVDGKHLISLDSKEVVAEQYPEVTSRDQKAIANQVATLNQNAEKANIVGRDYDNIFDAFKKTLSAAPREAGKMGGKLNDLKSGEFEDAAKGLKPFLKVCSDWNEDKECSIQGMEKEVRRLTDCPECAQVQGQILKEIKRETEGKITLRLALALVQLQQARKDPNINGSLCSCKKVVREIRNEIETMDGWFYGRKNAKKVPWPSDSVKHQWGTYGQPLCGGCKKYGLDHSTIDSDFQYIQSEASSEKTCFNGVRDRGRNNLGADGGGMRLDDFMKLKQAVETKLTRDHLLALRFYTSHSFTAINLALRDSDRETQHPLAAITMNVQDGIKQLRGLDAKGKSATAEINLWRGFTDMQVSQEFEANGGSEFAPMSTTTDPEVAVGYAVRKGMTNGSLLMKLKTFNNLQRGAELTWLSVFPGEAETLFPPLTFLQPTGNRQMMEHKGIKLIIVEVTTTLP